MKYDYKTSTDKSAAEPFRLWLEIETVNGLKRSCGDCDATRAVVFLFVNRAYEAHMPEPLISEVFAKSVVKAGYSEQEEDIAFDMLEGLAIIAKGVHGDAR